MIKVLERIAVALEEIAIGLNYLRRMENTERAKTLTKPVLKEK